MRINSPRSSPRPRLSGIFAPICFAVLAAGVTLPAAAQTTPFPPAFHAAAPDGLLSSTPAPQEVAAAAILPEAPLPAAPQHTPPPGEPGSPLPRAVSPYESVIAAGQTAPRQQPGDKILSALRSSVSPFSITGEVVAASYAQVADSTPHYGQTGSGYAQRFGAAVARGTTQSLFTTAIMANVLHEDTRYYQLGRGHGAIERGAYAVTRPFITRADDGRQTPNFALLSGYLGAAALTPLYYPARDQGAGTVFRTYGTSLGGAALGGLVHEFLPEVLEAVHLR